jgi:branched-chain amino acid aminotransferase
MTSTQDAEDDLRNQDSLIYVNGTLKPRAQTVVSVYESGFLLGESMWEGMRLYKAAITADTGAEFEP